MQPCDNHFKPIFILTHEQVLDKIKDMIEENRAAMKCSGTNSDYIEGRICSIRELAIELGLCEYEDLL